MFAYRFTHGCSASFSRRRFPRISMFGFVITVPPVVRLLRWPRTSLVPGWSVRGLLTAGWDLRVQVVRETLHASRMLPCSPRFSAVVAGWKSKRLSMSAHERESL